MDDGAVPDRRCNDAGRRMRGKRLVGPPARPEGRTHRGAPTCRRHGQHLSGNGVSGRALRHRACGAAAASTGGDHRRRCGLAACHSLPSCQARDLVAAGGAGADILMGRAAWLDGDNRGHAASSPASCLCGKRLLGFLADMLSPSQTVNPAYGYLWWINGQEFALGPDSNATRSEGKLIPAAPDDLVAMQGAGDRKLYLVPSLKLVVSRLGFYGDKDGVT